MYASFVCVARRWQGYSKHCTRTQVQARRCSAQSTARKSGTPARVSAACVAQQRCVCRGKTEEVWLKHYLSAVIARETSAPTQIPARHAVIGRATAESYNASSTHGRHRGDGRVRQPRVVAADMPCRCLDEGERCRRALHRGLLRPHLAVGTKHRESHGLSTRVQ